MILMCFESLCLKSNEVGSMQVYIRAEYSRDFNLVKRNSYAKIPLKWNFLSQS